MPRLSEAEIQALIAVNRAGAGSEGATRPGLAAQQAYFCRSLRAWDAALASLEAAGLLACSQGCWRLTPEGTLGAQRWGAARPHMYYWYTDYYRATRTSRAYAAFCRRAFGRDFAQHGFSDMAQLDRLIEVAALGPNSRVLDLGCGNGGIASYVSEATGAHVTGIDYIPEAIRQARQRARSNPRLSFRVMDMAALRFAPHAFDAAISIDTLYFVEEARIIRRLKALLAPGGQMLIFYGHGAGPGHPLATFDRQTLAPDKTPLGQALAANGLAFRYWDFSRADYEHALLKKQAIEDARAGLESEGNLFLYENRRGEAAGAIAASEAGANVRYLYQVQLGRE